MSQDNLQTVRNWIAALSAAVDHADAAIADFCDPAIDYYPSRKFLEAEPCHGTEEFAQFFKLFFEAQRVEWTIRELIAVGDDRVLVGETMHSEGRGSGMRIDGDLYQCYWL